MDVLINKKMKLASIWVAFSSVASQIFSLVSNLVLTRLLEPELFGIASVIMTLNIGLMLLTDTGLQASIIREKNENINKILPTVYFLQICQGLVLFIIFLLLSAFFSVLSDISPNFLTGTVYASDDFRLALILIAFSPLFTFIFSPHYYVLKKNLQQGKVFIIDFIPQVLGFLSALIIFYYEGQSIAVLVASAALTSFYRFIASYLVTKKITVPKFDPQVFKKLWGFGKWIIISSFSGFLIAYSDRVILSTSVDATTLGIYSISMLMVLSVKNVLGKLLNDIFYSSLSYFKNEDEINFKSFYVRSKQKIDSLLIFISVTIYISSVSIINFLYDDRYQQAGDYLKFLGFSILGLSLNAITKVIITLGNSKEFSNINLINFFIIYPLCSVSLYFYGIYGFIYAFISIEFLKYILSFYFEKKYLGIISYNTKFIVMAAFSGILLGFSINFVLGMI